MLLPFYIKCGVERTASTWAPREDPGVSCRQASMPWTSGTHMRTQLTRSTATSDEYAYHNMNKNPFRMEDNILLKWLSGSAAIFSYGYIYYVLVKHFHFL